MRIALAAAVIIGILPGEDRFSAPRQQLWVNVDFPGKPAPRWENGKLLVREIERPKITWFGADGQRQGEASIFIEGAQSVLVVDAVASPQGTIAVSGGADDSAATGTQFIAWIDSAGHIQRVVRTSPFIAYRLDFDASGKLWALGRDLLAASVRPEAAHSVLRQYDSEGKLIREMLSNESFPLGERHHPALKGLLAVATGRVGIYSTSRREWVEVSAESGEVLGRWAGPPASVNSITVTAGGTVYASAWEKQPSKRTAVFRFDRGAGRWQPVDLSQTLGQDHTRFGMLYGSEGELLLFGMELPAFSWVEVE